MFQMMSANDINFIFFSNRLEMLEGRVKVPHVNSEETETIYPGLIIVDIVIFRVVRVSSEELMG